MPNTNYWSTFELSWLFKTVITSATWPASPTLLNQEWTINVTIFMSNNVKVLVPYIITLKNLDQNSGKYWLAIAPKMNCIVLRRSASTWWRIPSRHLLKTLHLSALATSIKDISFKVTAKGWFFCCHFSRHCTCLGRTTDFIFMMEEYIIVPKRVMGSHATNDLQQNEEPPEASEVLSQVSLIARELQRKHISQSQEAGLLSPTRVKFLILKPRAFNEEQQQMLGYNQVSQPVVPEEAPVSPRKLRSNHKRLLTIVHRGSRIR